MNFEQETGKSTSESTLHLGTIAQESEEEESWGRMTRNLTTTMLRPRPVQNRYELCGGTRLVRVVQDEGGRVQYAHGRPLRS